MKCVAAVSSGQARRRWQLAVGLLLPLLSGCGVSVVGQWRMVETVPNREVFCIDNATFNRDGSFSATVTIDGKTTQERGTYRFNGFKLTLQPAAGGRREFNAMRKLGNLEVTDRNRKVVLKKGK
jgi:hypothetical protein